MIKSEASSVALISPDNNLGRYLDQIKKFPMLTAEDEYNLAKDWLDKNNTKAAHKLVTSHLRLVAKIAMGYRGYGLPVADLIAEGNIGMMHAVKKFDPEKGFRLATYAMWWIKAAIQEFVLRSWSQVKIGTTASQKKLFFNLRKIKSKINALDDGDLSPNQVDHIAKSLDVSKDDVVSMNRRMLGGDHLYGKALMKKKVNGDFYKKKLELIKQFKRQALHAIKLSFNHPITNKHLDFISPLPQDIRNLINILENNNS